MEEMSHHSPATNQQAMPCGTSMPMPTYYQLHVVLHGLIGVRLSFATRTVQLHIPSVPMHVYHAGSFHELKSLPYGHDYSLRGVRAGAWVPDSGNSKSNQLAVCLSEHGNLGCSPRATHATVTLPWPNDVGGVRKLLSCSPDPLFYAPNGLNPRRLHYITYLTYQVEAHTHYHPVLEWNCCKHFWRQEELHHHMRLHFFADPQIRLDVTQLPDHMSSAYDAFNDQVFQGGLAIEPNLDDGAFLFDPKSELEKIVPSSEAIDFAQIGHSGQSALIDPEQKVTVTSTGEGGNCLPVHVLD
jgi:hypothetical protein